MKKLFSSKVWTIPNLLSLIRLLIIPFFIRAYLKGKTVLAFVLVAVSALTDVIDGPIARALGQVTDLGKVLDPISDKLTEGAMIICVGLKHRPVLILFGMMAVKEACMSYMGLRTLRHCGEIHSARWYGKVCTVVLYASMLLFIGIPNISLKLVAFITAVCGASILMALLLYARWYRTLWREKDAECREAAN